MLAWFTWAAAGKLAGGVGKGLLAFVATPIGAALIAALVAYNAGAIGARHKANAAWQTKWDSAEKQAELDRLKRDALMKAEVQADADSKLDALSRRKDQLEQLVKKHEGDQSNTSGDSRVDQSDERWLRDARRGQLKPSRRR